MNTFNDIVNGSESLTPDEQLRLAAILIKKVSQTQITIQHQVWQNLQNLVSSGLKKRATKVILQEVKSQPANRWRAFFNNTAHRRFYAGTC